MTNEQFLIEAQVYYYDNHSDLDDSERIFGFLTDELKLLVIEFLCIDKGYMITKHELKFLVEKNEYERIKKLFAITFSHGENFTEEELEILGDELAYDWFSFS
jgi:hypothetical protein